MNKENDNMESTHRLTPQSLQNLKDRGFRYVQIKGYTADKREDHIEPHYLILVPFKDFSHVADKIEIYEPINSKILADWSKSPEDGIKIWVSAAH